MSDTIDNARTAMAKRVIDAAGNGHTDELREILATKQGKAVIDDLVEIDGYAWTALMWASGEGHVDCVHVLVDAKADVNKVDYYGQTALFWATAGGNECATALLDAGAEIDKSDNNGDTPLMQASHNGHEACVRLLIDRGADVNTVNNGGWSSLYWACRMARRAVATLLLQRGARMDEDWTKHVRGVDFTRFRDEMIAELGGADAVRRQYEEWLSTRPGRRIKSASKK